MAQKHILVIESNPKDASLIRQTLNALPFCTSFLCRSLGEARAYLARTGIYKDIENYPTPDSIITELKLDNDFAYELIAWMRQSPSTKTIPIYVFTAAIPAQDERLLKTLAVEAVIPKSANPTQNEAALTALARRICGG